MKVAILGFGVEGQDAARYFLKKGAQITVFDKKEKEEITKGEWESAPFGWMCGPQYLDSGIRNFDLIVRSPGIYRYIPEIVEAEKNGAKITSTTKIFFDECKTPIIAATGTKGKGTTSTLITKGLEATGKKVVLAGNIGEPMLSLLLQANNSDFVILELSSFQTIDLHKSPHIVVVTNITSDHMDWHTSQEEYEKAKEQLWKRQTKDDYLVLNRADKISRILSEDATGTLIWYHVDSPNKTEYAYSEQVDPPYSDEEMVTVNNKFRQSLDDFELPGKHNIANLLAALSAVSLTGADLEEAWKGITEFKGLEHRLENVAFVNKVLYINDSYATNPEPTIAAIRSFKQPIVLILGGSKKGADFSKLAQEIINSSVKAVVLIGDEADNIENALKAANFKGTYARGGKTMLEIVEQAKNLASDGNAVLLSPACASFGLFANYQERGQKFKEAVLKSI